MEEKGRIIDFDLKLLESFIEKRRPPVEIREKLDVAFRKEGQIIEIFTIRPHWKNENEKIETPIAKIKFVKSSAVWRLYWMRADLKWHYYEPAGEMSHLSKALVLIDEDKNGCFWG
jgi:hypothetical protein